MDSPVDRLKIEELPQRDGPLAFLYPTPEKPVFRNDHEAVTRDAADRLATCFNKLVTRRVERELAQRFILQSLVALFSEDIGLLEPYMFTRLLDECDGPQKSYDLLGQLFVEMNTPGTTPGGRLKGVDYFNGGLFAQPARIELYPDEIAQLRKAAEANWSKVRPEIFGTLFEHSVDQVERRAYGAHFTHPVDIMKIVGPTIVQPWRELIDEARSIKRLKELRKRLTEFIVLDPACGFFRAIPRRNGFSMDSFPVTKVLSYARRSKPHDRGRRRKPPCRSSLSHWTGDDHSRDTPSVGD
jgi:type II restriction/modification system DNA methylase subunit YeeA